MSIKRITISVPSQVAKRIRRSAGNAAVSAWITDVVEKHLQDAELEKKWVEFYEETAPTPADARIATALFSKLTRPARRKRAA